MQFDFKLQKDEYGYFIIAYRIIRGVEQQYITNNAIATTLKLSEQDYKEFIYNEFGSDKDSKNHIMHFDNYDKAIICLNRLRELIPIAKETNNLYLV